MTKRHPNGVGSRGPPQGSGGGQGQRVGEGPKEEAPGSCGMFTKLWTLELGMYLLQMTLDGYYRKHHNLTFF